MVDALREARRVLTPPGVLIDLRPVTEPLVLEVTVGGQAVWAKKVEVYSAPEEVAAADTAVRHALSRGWLVLESSGAFDFEIDCDSAGELRDYAATRKFQGTELPYEELEEQRCGWGGRLRCRRPWAVSTYRKR